MNDWITQWSALPNLHPAVIHFPLAWLPLAVGIEAVALARARYRERLGAWAAGAWILAALAIGLAYWAGHEAAEAMTGLAPDLQAAVNTHADWGLRTLWTVGLLAAIRIGVWLRPAWRHHAAVAACFLIAGLGALAVITRTADLGGALVYRHGIAVQPAEQARRAEAARQPAAPRGPTADARFRRRADGFRWDPAPRDADALGSILLPAPGTDLAAVRALDARPDDTGLGLAVDGEAILLFPPEEGDAQVAVRIDLSGFTGSVALLHHVRTAADYEALRLELPEGAFTLLEQGAGGSTTFDRATASVPSGPVELAVSAIGRHLRGTLDGRLVVHGHRPAATAPGRIGLRLAGRGTLRIHSFVVETTGGAIGG